MKTAGAGPEQGIEPRWLLDGIADALLDPNDRGLLYGDGLFETIAFHHGRRALLSLHMQRLGHGWAGLGLVMPSIALLAREASVLIGQRARAVVRITLTRGRGGAGYFPPQGEAVPTRLLQRREFPRDLDASRARGLELRTSPIWLEGGAPAGLKHLSRLTQVMIARELQARGGDEVVVLDAAGRMIEALHGNLVVVRAGRLIEPVPHPAAVAGIGLQWLRSRAGASMEQAELYRDRLQGGDGLWVMNSCRGPIAACRLDNEPFEPDPLIREWQARWQQDIEQ